MVSPEFKLYIIKDYQRLKKDESERKAIGWDEKRAFIKELIIISTLMRYKKYLITDSLTEQEKGYKFANEADMINVALFGKKKHGNGEANIPDEAKKR